jgi:hypothetical protein
MPLTKRGGFDKIRIYYRFKSIKQEEAHMIKIERISVMNFENAIRGMRNPMNSWDKSDSFYCEECHGGLCEFSGWNGRECPVTDNNRFVIGQNDLRLAQKLVKAGSDHRKFLRQIIISMDITAPLYWWKEFDTYKVGTVANSCSTMHKIHTKEFTADDFSFERTYKDCSWYIESTLNVLNTARERYLETKDKVYWDTMIQFLPTSYNQLRTVTLSYENALSICRARRNHKLVEWHVLCDKIETLPNFKEICLDGDDNE